MKWLAKQSAIWGKRDGWTSEYLRFFFPHSSFGILMSQPQSKQLRILFLEDSPADRELIAEHLEAEGWECHFAFVKSRRQFEAALADGKFDLILSDFKLPQYNGMDAMRSAQRAQPETPFLFVSATLRS